MVVETVATGTTVVLPQLVGETNAHPLVLNLVPVVVAEVQVVAREMLVSAETIRESAALVPADNHKTETDRTDERLHWVFKTLVDDEEEDRTVVLFERETEPLNGRPRQRPPRNVERFVCQKALFRLALLLSLLTKNRWLLLSSL